MYFENVHVELWQVHNKRALSELGSVPAIERPPISLSIQLSVRQCPMCPMMLMSRIVKQYAASSNFPQPQQSATRKAALKALFPGHNKPCHMHNAATQNAFHTFHV